MFLQVSHTKSIKMYTVVRSAGFLMHKINKLQLISLQFAATSQNV